MEFPSVDRSKFEEIDLYEQKNDYDYWMSKTPEERLAALEMIRQVYNGPSYDPATARLQRVLEIVEREPG